MLLDKMHIIIYVNNFKGKIYAKKNKCMSNSQWYSFNFNLSNTGEDIGAFFILKSHFPSLFLLHKTQIHFLIEELHVRITRYHCE